MPENEHEVVVTKDNIREGVPGLALSCPLALAIREGIPGVSAVYVGPDSVVLSYGSRFRPTKAVTVPLPPQAREFVRHVDNVPLEGEGGIDDRVAPFSFPLRVDGQAPLGTSAAEDGIEPFENEGN